MNNSEEDKVAYDYTGTEELGDNVDAANLLNTSSGYLDDDEAFLAGDDVLLSEQAALSIFQQSENVISYEVINFYDDKGKARNSLSLRNEPPILRISSSNNDSADFLLTKELSKHLSTMLKDVDRAYMGVSPKRATKPLTQEGIRDRFDAFVEWVRGNKIKAGLLGIVVLLFVVYSVINFS